jgi:MFS transporter, SP family, sugar:H+ symporter
MKSFRELPFIKYFTRNLAIATLLIGMSVFNYGFDMAGYNTIQAMDRMSKPLCLLFLDLSKIHNIAFIERFGTYNPTTKKFAISPKNLSLLNSLPRITFGLGIVMGGLLGERFGRRPVYILMLLICEIGTIISYFAKNFTQILAGRMLNQMYIGMEGWLVPMFHAEIIPAPIRGAVVVGYVFNHIFGSFIMSCITFKTSQWDTDHCWQIPVAVMFILPTIALALCWFVPESPRWLLRRGKDEKALKMMRYIYGSNPEYAPEQEMALLKASLEIEEEKGTWKELFVGTNLVSINTSSKVLKFVPQY